MTTSSCSGCTSRPISTPSCTRSRAASTPSTAGASPATRASAQTAAIELGGPDWFILGDRDIGLHLVRSERLRAGEPLSSITDDLARRLGLAVRLLPATDDPLRTRIGTDAGELEFQQWLVGRRAVDAVRSVRFDGLPAAPAPGVLDAIRGADVIVLAPSNPFVSLDPILAVEGVREAILARRDRVVAISPIIAGKAVKGPLAGMLETLGPAPGHSASPACSRRSRRRSCWTTPTRRSRRRSRRSACARSSRRR